MKPTQLYERLIEATFTDRQARAIVQAFQEAGLCEKGEIGTEQCLILLDKLLEAEPFAPFEIESGTATFKITSREQCRFNRFGNPVIRLGDGKTHILFSLARVATLTN